jgi:exodeoxyribonuclease VII large subunit
LVSVQPIKLSELTRQIAKVISINFSSTSYWVIAEITNLKFYPAKNYYFLDLVEKDELTNTVLTSIKANAWSTAVQRIKIFENITGQKFDNNIKLLLRVNVEYHITYGLKLNIIDVDPAFTIGNLEQQRQATLALLVKNNAGYIDYIQGEYLTFNKSLDLNPVIQHIALIASPDSDGFKDFMHELQHNAYGYVFYVDIYAAQVQGAGMETGIVNRLVEIFTSGKEYDAAVIVRGGGAQTDLLIFDSYELAKAVAKFPIPVFTGIGHTRNESITDLMAFMATKTPTKVAANILAHNRRFEEQLEAHEKTIVSKSLEIIASQSLFLSQANGIITAAAKDVVHGQHLKLSELTATIRESSARLFTNAKNLLGNYSQLVKHLSPETVLKRGYALVYYEAKIVTDVKKIIEGAGIKTVMSTGDFQSTVTAINENENGRTEL